MTPVRALTDLPPDEKRQLLSQLLDRQEVSGCNSNALREEALLCAHRRLFPALRGKSYFNFGARGPLPQPAMDAIRQAFEEVEAAGPFSQEALLLQQRATQDLREELARTLGVASGSIALTENTTAACNIALWGIDWKPSDHLLLSDCEHLSGIAVAQEIRDRFGIALTYFRAADARNSAVVFDAIERELRPNTRLVMVSHVFWNTGVVAPLESIQALARERTSGRCQVLVDGAQAAGLFDIERAADFYAFPAGKWFCGPAGVGALVVRPEAHERLRPVFGGWRGALVSEPEGDVHWRSDAARYEGGSSCHPLYRGWQTAIRVHEQWANCASRRAHAIEMNQALCHRLADLRIEGLRTEPTGSGILTVRIPGAERIARLLEAESVFARALPYPESLRICTHYLTSWLDLQRLTQALSKVSGGKLCRL